MSLTKLDNWAALLLDIGKNNPLMSYKITKEKEAELIMPSPEDIYKKLCQGEKIEIVVPKIEELKQQNLIKESVSSKEAYEDLFSSKVKSPNQALVFNKSFNAANVLKKIAKNDRVSFEETGISITYCAFGLINWNEQDDAYTYQAPLLLVPIKIIHDSPLKPYYIIATDDTPIVNANFSYSLLDKYNIELPTFEEADTLETYFTKATEVISRFNWTIEPYCCIGNFSFQKLSMYRDIIDNEGLIFRNPVARKIIGAPTDETIETASSQKPQIHCIYDADSSQEEAIVMAKQGKSFVLQGPPGTGKSQTITNIIAELLFDNKKVLFVSEKKAALEVVYNKLYHAGFGDFCLELHSQKTNKKNFIDELYEATKKSVPINQIRMDAELDQMNRSKSKLDLYVQLLHKENEKIKMSLYDLFEKYSEIEYIKDIPYVIKDIQSIDYLLFNKQCELFQNYVAFTQTIGYDYKKFVWYGLTAEDNMENKNAITASLSKIEQVLPEVNIVLDDIYTRFGIKLKDLQDVKTLANIFKNAHSYPIGFFKQENFDEIIEKCNRLSELTDEILAIRNRLDPIYTDKLYNIEGQILNVALRRYASIFSRHGNEYNSQINKIFTCKKDGKKVKYKEALSISLDLMTIQSFMPEYEDLISYMSRLGVEHISFETNWKSMATLAEDFKNAFDQGIRLGKIKIAPIQDIKTILSDLIQYSDILITDLDNIKDSISTFNKMFDNTIFDLTKYPLDNLYSYIQNSLKNITLISTYYAFSALIKDFKDNNLLDLLELIIANNIPKEDITNVYKKLYYRFWIENIMKSNPMLSKFSRYEQDQYVKTFADIDRRVLEFNRDRMNYSIALKINSLSSDEKNEELKIIRHEGEKKRRRKSIRQLLDEAGSCIQILKPCFMMSPLSVSTYLNPNKISFDCIIFDEASQVFAQDAIGAIYRGSQLIIVGDSKQMPPTNFFLTALEGNNLDDALEGYDAQNYDSILDLCSAVLPSKELRWHYRSKFEQLIAFSNYKFYKGNLTTFPAIIPNKADIGIDYHYVDGIYSHSSHTNKIEALEVVNLIYQHINEFPNRTLGVVAFSISQQSLIEDLLFERRKTDFSGEVFFNAHPLEPFFIKNLETVQGDERDTIIFSVAYGKDEKNKLNYNFGPLNKEGGERRLNVAITRSKYNIKVVTSLHSYDIDLSHSTQLGTKLLHDYLEFAECEYLKENNESEEIIQTKEPSLFFEKQVYDFLIEKGFNAEYQLGHSSNKIDIAIKNPVTNEYAIAIEFDGNKYNNAKSTRDRDRLRKEVLNNMGWEYYTIWSTSWFLDPVSEKKNLLDFCNSVLATDIASTDISALSTYASNINDDDSLDFKLYKEIDAVKLFNDLNNGDTNNAIKQTIIKTVMSEAPISDEYLLSRIVTVAFGRNMITEEVRKKYDAIIEEIMNSDFSLKIHHRNGFFFLEGAPIQFRMSPSDSICIHRDIEYISLEELSDGLLKIITANNEPITKQALLEKMTYYVGANNKSPSTITFRLEAALETLKNDIKIKENYISLKE